MNKCLFLICPFLIAGSTAVRGQIKENLSKVSFEGYAELYYSYDFNRPNDHIRQPFLYNYNRHNTIMPNFVYGKAKYESENVRGNIGLMAGSYVTDNLSAEPVALRFLSEANVGFKVARHSNCWIDMGILPSHIGWESVIGASCPTLTRSLTAENTPAFETGINGSYHSPNDKWYVSLMLFNGWQNIEKSEGLNGVAVGHQITFTPNSKITLNSSSYIGKSSNNVKSTRLFHDFYAIFQPTNHLSVITGFDIGADQKENQHSKYDVWYSPVIIAQYKFNPQQSIALRGEYYSDKNGVMIAMDNHKTNLWGLSVNYDQLLFHKLYWRNELRGLWSSEPYFKRGNKEVKDNISFTTSLALYF